MSKGARRNHRLSVRPVVVEPKGEQIADGLDDEAKRRVWERLVEATMTKTGCDREFAEELVSEAARSPIDDGDDFDW